MKLIDIDIEDIDFENRKCLVGTKEKSIYFDVRTKIHLKNYLKNWTDVSLASFISLDKSFNRLQTSGVKISLEEQ